MAFRRMALFLFFSQNSFSGNKSLKNVPTWPYIQQLQIQRRWFLKNDSLKNIISSFSQNSFENGTIPRTLVADPIRNDYFVVIYKNDNPLISVWMIIHFSNTMVLNIVFS